MFDIQPRSEPAQELQQGCVKCRLVPFQRSRHKKQFQRKATTKKKKKKRAILNTCNLDYNNLICKMPIALTTW